MSRERQQTGKTGEDLAMQYLNKIGYTVLERNYRCQFGEIDIIAKQGKELVFIEVKTRKTELFGAPADAVTPQKQRQISRAAQFYLATNSLDDATARFDVVSVLLRDGIAPLIEVIPGAFESAMWG